MTEEELAQALREARCDGAKNAYLWLALELLDIGRYETISVGRVLDMMRRLSPGGEGTVFRRAPGGEGLPW